MTGENTAMQSDASARNMVRLSIAALFLTGFRRDVYLWAEHVEQERILNSINPTYNTMEEYQDYEYSGNIDIESHNVGFFIYPDLLLAQVLGPIIPSVLIYFNVNPNCVRLIFNIVNIVYPPVWMYYSTPYTLKYIGGILVGCSCLREVLRAGKAIIYFYQIIIFSSTSERSSAIKYAVIAQCLGNAILQWVGFELNRLLPHAIDCMELVIAIIQYALFFRSEPWDVRREYFQDDTRYVRPKRLASAAFVAILFASVSNVMAQWLVAKGDIRLIKPFLPLYASYETEDYFWNALCNVVLSLVFGFHCRCISTSLAWISSFVVVFFTAFLSWCIPHSGEIKLIQWTVPWNAFVLGPTLAQLVEICTRRNITLLLGTVFVASDLTMYGFFALLQMFPVDAVYRVTMFAHMCYIAIVWITSNILSEKQRDMAPVRGFASTGSVGCSHV